MKGYYNAEPGVTLLFLSRLASASCEARCTKGCLDTSTHKVFATNSEAIPNAVNATSHTACYSNRSVKLNVVGPLLRRKSLLRPESKSRAALRRMGSLHRKRRGPSSRAILTPRLTLVGVSRGEGRGVLRRRNIKRKIYNKTKKLAWLYQGIYRNISILRIEGIVLLKPKVLTNAISAIAK